MLAQNGFVLDVNALYNFGMLDGRVKAIDFGNRPLRTSLEKKDVTAAMKQFWHQATTLKHSLPLSSEQQKEYQDLHDWFRVSRWADTRFSLLNCIEDLREKVAQNPLMNVAPGAGSFGVDSSSAHAAFWQRPRKRRHCENDQDLSDLEEAA